VVTNDPGGFHIDVRGPEGDPHARDMTISTDDVQPIN